MLRRSFLKSAVSTAGVALAGPAPAQEEGHSQREIIFNLRNYCDMSGREGTELRNAEGLQSLLREIASAGGSFTVVGRKGDVYRLGGTSTWTFPTKGRLQLDGGAIHLTEAPGVGNGARLRFSKGCAVEGMELVALPGSFDKRLVEFEGANLIRDCHIWAAEQAANEGKLLDYAVRIQRGENIVERLKVENFDKSLLAFGADGDGKPGRGNRFKDVTVKNYVTGFELRNLDDCRNEGFRCSGRAPNAKRDPGQNGLLHSGVSSYTLTDFEINDAGEHGCRFGGTRGNEQASQNITISRGKISRSAQTGMKFFTGKVGQRFRGVTAENVEIVDCQFVRDKRKKPGFNDEGLLLQQIEGGKFSGITVTKSSSEDGYSCDCGVFITGASDLSLTGLWVTNTLRDFIRVSQWDDGTGKRPVETLPTKGLSISDAVGRDISGSALFLEFPESQISQASFHLEATGVDGPKQRALDGKLGDGSASNVALKYTIRNFGPGDAVGRDLKKATINLRRLG